MSLGRALPVPCLAGEAEFGAVGVAVGCLGRRGCTWASQSAQRQHIGMGSL